MTNKKRIERATERLLESILAKVESIDRNVEDILDQLTDHVADVRYAGWQDDAYHDKDPYMP